MLCARFSRRALLRGSACSLAAPLARAFEGMADYGVSALVDGTGMARIPAGEFLMGSPNGNSDEQPVHRVRITRPFEMSKYEITQAQWDIVMRNPHENPPKPVSPSHFKDPAAPVESVSWDDISLFLTRLNVRDSAHRYRLPTEAEWEYACGAGGSDPGGNLTDIAWFGANSQARTNPVGTKKPNAWGLYDMLGNVSEWVNDWYDREYYAASPEADPQGPPTGSYRIYRGGCWFDDAADCRAAWRGFDFPINRFYNVGFRVVRTTLA